MILMSIQAYGATQRYEMITVENDRDRTAAEARQIALKKHPDIDRIVIVGRNGHPLHEEYLLRPDGVWIDKQPPREKKGLSFHGFISYVMRRLFP